MTQVSENSKESPSAAADGSESSRLKPLVKRYWPILIITWIVHLGLGLCISITGPTLPYLALNTGQYLGSVSFVYTVRSIVVCVTSVLVGLALARLTGSQAKLALLLVGSLLTAGYAVLTPFANSLVNLILAQCLFGVGAGVVDTVDNMLVIYLFGPVLSRSFSHSLHFCVGLGGFLAPVLARPFLVSMGDPGSDGSVCSGGGGGGGGANSTVVTLDPLKWPYVIVGSLHSLWLVGYALLLLGSFQLEKFKVEQPTELKSTVVTTEVTSPSMSRRRQALVLVLFVLFYVLHVGQENVFWSHLYSFGVCSPKLKMQPDQAANLSTFFFIGFLVSRAVGIVLARLLRPAVILLVQLTGCLLTTTVLAVWGEESHTVAYVFCALYGFCIAMVFPTGITWLASKMEVTGALSSAWFIGAYVGNSTYPLAAGQLIASPAGAISMMYLAAGTSALYLIVVGAMFKIAA